VTLARISPIAKRLGISRVANVTGLDNVGVPVWVAIRPLAKSLTVSQGKGLTHELAKCSCIMESIELYHAEHFRPYGITMPFTTYAGNEDFINPLRLPLHVDAQIPEDESVYWVRGKELISGKDRWIPHDMFNLDATKTIGRCKAFISSSNGLASGNTLEEAVLHGLCEVIERDQLSMWLIKDRFSQEQTSRKLNLDSVDDPHACLLLDLCRKAGLEIIVWCATTNIDIPVFVSVVADHEGKTLFRQRAAGSGCHPMKSIALCRAVTEALQSRLTHISGTRDDVYWSSYRNDIVFSHRSASWISEIREPMAEVDFADVRGLTLINGFESLVNYTTLSLLKAGIDEIIVVDLTQPHIGLPVAFVCVPDLEFSVLKPAYSPGRRMLEALRACRVH
jgi:YcaO-like protein with predicted kinase domain